MRHVPKRVPDVEIEEEPTFSDENDDPEYGMDDWNKGFDGESDDNEGDDTVTDGESDDIFD